MAESTQVPNPDRAAEDVSQEKESESESVSAHESNLELDESRSKSKRCGTQAVTWTLAIAALIVSVFNLCVTCDNWRSNKTIQVQHLLAEAMDYLGGENSIPRAGTTEVSKYPTPDSIELALRKLEDASVLEPNNPKVIKMKAIVLHVSEKYDEAIEKYQEAIKADPTCASAYNDLGVCYLAIYKTKESIDALEKATELDNHDSSYYSNLGLSHFLSGNVESSVDCFKHALKLVPNDPSSLTTLGVVYIRSGRIDEGIAQLKKARSIDNTSPNVYHNLGSAYVMLGQYDKALATYEIAARLAPTSGAVFNDLGSCLIYLDRKKDAIEKFETALDNFDPDNILILDNLASLYREFGRIAEADALAQKSGKLKVENRAAPYGVKRGQIFLSPTFPNR
jgi:tetratricopeptide (TPR) repeat protein